MSEGNEKKTMEVIKFAVSIGIPLIAGAIGYGNLQNKVSNLEQDVAQHKVLIDKLEAHNVAQDLETATFRANMTNRVENIEKLTKDIHAAVVGN